MLLFFAPKNRTIVNYVIYIYNKAVKEVEVMRNPKYHLYMDYGEYREIIDALIAKKNDLIATGHYTDAIDEILIKLSRAKQKKVKVIYTA